MKQLNLYEAKTQLSELVDRASKGEIIIIAKAGTPRAKLVPLDQPERPQSIELGGMEGKIWIADDFDAPLPDWLLDLFEGKGE